MVRLEVKRDGAGSKFVRDLDSCPEADVEALKTVIAEVKGVIRSAAGRGLLAITLDDRVIVEGMFVT